MQGLTSVLSPPYTRTKRAKLGNRGTHQARELQDSLSVELRNVAPTQRTHTIVCYYTAKGAVSITSIRLATQRQKPGYTLMTRLVPTRITRAIPRVYAPVIAVRLSTICVYRVKKCSVRN